MEQELLKAVINAGGTAAIAALLLYLVYKIALRLTMDVGMKAVAAFEKQAAAMEGLTQSIKEFVSRDNSEHREIIILQKLIIDKLKAVEESINGRKERKIS